MRDKDDWRLTNQHTYLHGASLKWKRYIPYSDAWEHDHCEFCWKKFMDADDAEVAREGYVTEDNYHWVCQQCFKDFKDEFNWTALKI